MTKCLWHECQKDFAPHHHLQRFCSTKCQLDRASWKSRRGAVLVDLLLSNDMAGLNRERLKLLKETQ